METKQDPAPLHAECNHGQATQRMPTPLHVGHMKDTIKSGHELIAETYGDAENAAYIVRAVNAHESLLAALREILEWDDVNPTIPAVDVMRARQAIAKAEGK